MISQSRCIKYAGGIEALEKKKIYFNWTLNIAGRYSTSSTSRSEMRAAGDRLFTVVYDHNTIPTHHQGLLLMQPDPRLSPRNDYTLLICFPNYVTLSAWLTVTCKSNVIYLQQNKYKYVGGTRRDSGEGSG